MLKTKFLNGLFRATLPQFLEILRPFVTCRLTMLLGYRSVTLPNTFVNFSLNQATRRSRCPRDQSTMSKISGDLSICSLRHHDNARFSVTRWRKTLIASFVIDLRFFVCVNKGCLKVCKLCGV